MQQKIKLPINVAPYKEAQRKSSFSGYYPKERFSRLQQMVNKIEQDAATNIFCEIDLQNLVVIALHAIISVEVICERCNEVFSKHLEITSKYSPLLNEKALSQMPEEYEPIGIDEFGEVNLPAIIEDEFILSLPLVNKHDLDKCKIKDTQQIFGEIPEEEPKPNPFAVLSALKK